MPNHVQLISKTTKEAETFADIDTKMRIALGQPADDARFYKAWYDTIAFGLACGCSWQELRKDYEGTKDDVIDWLEKNYEPDSWASR